MADTTHLVQGHLATDMGWDEHLDFWNSLINAADQWCRTYGESVEVLPGFLEEAESIFHTVLEVGVSDLHAVPSSGGPYWLYRLYSESGRLIYIGVTKNPRRRLASHRRRFGDVLDHWTWESYETRQDVLAAEARAIDNEDPAFNVDHPEPS